MSHGVRVVVIVLFVLAAIFGLMLRDSHQQLLQARKDNAELKDERDEARALSQITMQAVRFNNEITRATHEQKNHVSESAQQSIIYIKQRLSPDLCANSPIDGLAVERLRDLETELRGNATGSDSGRVAN